MATRVEGCPQPMGPSLSEDRVEGEQGAPAVGSLTHIVKRRTAWDVWGNASLTCIDAIVFAG